METGRERGEKRKEGLSPRLESTPSVRGEAGEIGPVKSTGELAATQEQEGSKRKEMASSRNAAEIGELKN